MVVSKKKIDSILEDYKDFTIATICSHTSLQIFHGAKMEGIKTLGIVSKKKRALYESFPYGRPDEFFEVDDIRNIPFDELLDRNIIIVPHGSFVEYVGEKLDDLEIPIYGNRASLEWERDRNKMFQWLKKAGLKTPKIYKPEEIDSPVLVKFPGAKGGRGYVIVRSYEEFQEKVKGEDYMIQEFLVGVRAYMHYFFSPITPLGYKTRHGHLQIMGMDRRIESSADEISRALSAGAKADLSFTVIGNEPIVLRESLLHDYIEIGERVIDTSFELFGGMYGPYCIETMVSEDLEIYAFEISARIVAGTNIYPEGSPYSVYYYQEPMSMGRRIARELRVAFEKGLLNKIVY